jgi:hypothetical protein
MKQRRRSAATQDEQLDWDKVPEQRIRVGKRSNRRWGRLVAIGIAALTLVGALLFLIQRKRQPNETPAPIVVEKPQEISGSAPEPIDLPLEMNRNQTELLAELEPLARKFLTAASVDEMLPLVRNRDTVEKKMRAFYPNGTIAAPGMSAFNTSGNLSYRGKLASVAVRTDDFSSKQLAYIRTAEGMKIDWESYVGWSEMTWDDLLSKKPTKPTIFRASLRLVDYYNFSFSDEGKWQSYQLRSPDGQHVVYGYVKRDSGIDKRLRPAEKNSGNLVTVSLKFPLGETSKNQVLIEEILADGWVEGAGDK